MLCFPKCLRFDLHGYLRGAVCTAWLVLIIGPAVVAQSSSYTDTVNGVVFRMIAVEGGAFRMGCAAASEGDCFGDESPLHTVVLSDYRMGQTEVTQALWRAVMGTRPSRFAACDECPVENVSWDEIQAFLRQLNALTGQTYRLPTEAEWEFAARGGKAWSGQVFSGGGRLEEVAWFQDNAGSRPHPVKGKNANELGLYDMSGNVYEWCQDGYGAYTSDEQKDPIGRPEGSRKVIRGGGWQGSERFCRVSYRFYYPTDFRANYLGFRLARP
jgi:formylglycine-generating enzyme required for sulfatase activity